ncbi:uncharacterized protein [Rutidosis leptorrhynchoides]|uniref:uncharacterized protein n=1 Tax=Rutidosis leptorrhynchoides TaxID=125765 RepID=UPI003A9A5D60
MEFDENEQEDINNKPKTTKSNRNKIDDNEDESLNKQNTRGIILSVTKPSYTLKGGIGSDLRSIRCEHRNRLRYLLRQLVRRQNWSEASGVLSVLLKGTHRDNGFSTNRSKYWAALEILNHMAADKVKPRKMQQVYEIWMKKSYAITKNKRLAKGRFDVQLEYLLFCIAQGDNDGAYQAMISLQQESDFASDPIANLLVGLSFSHLWYNAIQKEMHLDDSSESSTSFQSVSGMSAPPEPIISVDLSIRQSAVEVQVSNSSQPDSNTSVRIGKPFDPEEVFDRDRVVPMAVDRVMKKEVLEYDESVESDQSGNPSQFPHTGSKRYGSIFYARDLETLLMPIRFPGTNTFEDFISFQKRIQNDHYKAAVKHLRAALHLEAFEALLPLIQMLLVGDQVKEAIEEVESVVQNSHASLPFRLRASLLEHFSNEDVSKMCACFEDTLNKDPTCRHSLLKLINLHYDGRYSIEKLVEMIAKHLEASYPDCHIWKEFASCFIKLSHCDEDRMSSCVGDSCTKRSANVPDMFKDDEVSDNWRLRCRWWQTRHFTQTRLTSEIASGNMELVGYKAASACHLYGPEFTYVVKAYAYLKEEKNQFRPILKMHMENAIGLKDKIYNYN